MVVSDVTDGLELRRIMESHRNQNKLLVLEFKASWSEPCKYMKKVLDGNLSVKGLAQELQADADFYALDIAVFKQFSQRMTVEALPTFLLLNKGYEVLGRVVGVDKEELRKSIKEHKEKPAKWPVLRVVDPDKDIDNKPPTLFTSPWAWLQSLF